MVPGTKATYENEFILGARYQATSLLSFGIQGTYRELKHGAEDTDFHQQLADHFCAAGANFNQDRCDFYTSNSTYYIWNPGASTVTLNDWLLGSSR